MIMSYTLTLGSLHVLTEEAESVQKECSCDEARLGCTPSFVFSVAGQVGFRTALHHLSTCQKMTCKSLRASVFTVTQKKLRWLMKEESMLGCIHVQPALYGAKKVLIDKKGFPIIAEHLSRCPKESCAQLRRSVLLDIRDALRPS